MQPARETTDEVFFIHINKTGGSSIEVALKMPFEHKTALEKIAEVGRPRWDKALTFTVVRNPWDKVVSHYHFRVETNQTNLGTHPVDFGNWVRLTYGGKHPFYYENPKMFMPQSDWITDREGAILVNRICRFETLSDDFSALCKQLKRDTVLPHLRSTQRGHYRAYYDDGTVNIVAEWFKKDIERFGYQF